MLPVRRSACLMLFSGLLLAISITGCVGAQFHIQSRAQEDLDRMLPPAQLPGQLAKPGTPGMQDGLFSGLPNWRLNIAQPDMQVNETPQAYEITVPLANNQNPDSVQAQASGQTIQIRGEQALGGENGGQSWGTSTFVKSWTVPQPLRGDQITRRVDEKPHQLVITIPKAAAGAVTPRQSGKSHGGKAGDTPDKTPAAAPNPPGTLPPELQRQLNRMPGDFI
ncbi:MAG: hypothetical protein AB7P76_03095 [Candidatus Melainabacteria bacterium]